MPIYWWVCALFGIFHIQRSRNTLGSRSYFSSGDWQFSAFFFCIFVVWWYWPVIVMNSIADSKDKKAKELEEFKRKNV